jgi:cbb3-type cytochrome oxidase subunit 3
MMHFTSFLPGIAIALIYYAAVVWAYRGEAKS